MLYTNINSPKALYFTLYAKCSNVLNPTFSFHCKNKETLLTYSFSAADFSYAPYYWNSFTVSIISTPAGNDINNGVIYMPYGSYEYNVIENGTGGVVDNGLLTINVATFSSLQENTHIPYTEVNRNI